MKSSFNKCVLVWVDDNFINNNYLNENEDVDKWNEIFGGISKKIYRLLDLELEILTTKSDFDTYLKNIENVLDTYYYFILDLSVPKTIHDEAKVINGLKMGTALNDKNYDFCYLSSNSSAGKEMQDHGLASVDYYIKFNENVLLPESLSHKILISFRNNISWINLNTLYSSINKESNLFNLRNDRKLNMELSIFPYFDKFKDFIDRSELESHQFNKIIFIRSHKYNSLEFEAQSILIMMTNVIFSNPGNITISYGKFGEDSYRNTIIKDTHNLFWFVKMNTTDSIDKFKEFYTQIMHKRVFFIIENNEDAERFLESVTDSTHTTIKDLPYINKNDSSLRHELTQKALSLLLHLKHTSNNGIKFHSLYLDYPELLLNPLNLNLMENPKFTTEDISDIPEIIMVFKDSLDNISTSINNTLSSGNPFENPDDFFKVAQGVLKEDTKQVVLVKILINTMDRWLKDSWLFPYGIQIDAYHNEEITLKWKKISFDILKMLSKQLSDNKIVINHLQERKILLTNNSNDIRLQEINKLYDLSSNDVNMDYLETYNDVRLVLNVLNSEVMDSIINSDTKKVSAETWEELSYLKWPHTTYPMPWYLNDILIKNNKHLWIQHENFNFVGYSEKLVHEHRKLNSMLEYYDTNLNFIEKTYKYFPLKMQNLIKQFVIGIKQKNIVNNAEFTENFKNFANTTLNISSLFGSCIHKPKTNDIVKIVKNLNDLASFGTKLSYIRDTQFKDKYLFKIKDNTNHNHEKYLTSLKKNIFYLYNKTNYSQNNSFLESIYQQFSVRSFTIDICNSKGKEIKVYKTIELDERGNFQVDISALPDDAYKWTGKIITNDNKTKTITDIIAKTPIKSLIEGQIDLREVSSISELVNSLSKVQKLNTKLTFSKETKKISEQDLYDLTLLKSNNRTVLQQVQNITNNMGHFDMYFNILKFIDGIELYEFMTDTRNKAVEHQKLKINFDYMFESFIYSYESIWLQYQYLVKNIDSENKIADIEANYIEFDVGLDVYENAEFSLGKILSSDIKTKDDLNIYLDSLLEEKKN